MPLDPAYKAGLARHETGQTLLVSMVAPVVYLSEIIFNIFVMLYGCRT
jgi:hypothetical protein